MQLASSNPVLRPAPEKRAVQGIPHAHPFSSKATRRSQLHSSKAAPLKQHRSSCLSCKASVQVWAAVEEASLQLATAKLPKDVNADKFASNLYNWAATLTSSGQNLPFVLPLRTKKLSNGFQISLLRISNGEPVDVGHLRAEVEDEPNVGNVLFVRFLEGRGSQLVRNSPLPSDTRKRLELVVQGLVDIPTIMSTLKPAISKAVSQSK